MVTEKKRVLLGMSGGTDSSVAAMLLQDAGYEVVGITFRFYEVNDSIEYLEDARILAGRLGIKHITFDAREIFREKIITYFIHEYLSGRTPVPCTICNNSLKWPLLAKVADEMGIFYISTGHYVRTTYKNGKHYIMSAIDSDKDQSFFLWGLGQDILCRVLFPMGEFTKPEARTLALERGYERVATKRDSLGVCFCPMDYRSFLKKYIVSNGQVSNVCAGKFVDEMGRFIAYHEGYPFYTIGQRRGLGIDLNRAVYVKEIRLKENEVVLSPLQALEKKEMWLENWNIIDEASLIGKDDIVVKIRYRKQKNYCTVSISGNGLLHVQLHEPLTAVAPGQAAAFYKEGILLGGGIIRNAR